MSCPKGFHHKLDEEPVLGYFCRTCGEFTIHRILDKPLNQQGHYVLVKKDKPE